MTMRSRCIVMRGMNTPAIRHDRPDHLAPAWPPASDPTRPALVAAAPARP